MQWLKKPTVTETIRLNRLRWFGHVQIMEENRIHKRILYMNLGTMRLRGRPRRRWQDEVREDGRIAGREGWQEKVHNREERKKLLRTARNHRILHMPMESLYVLYIYNIIIYNPMCSNISMSSMGSFTFNFITNLMHLFN